ncbi:aminoacetone oxidase family FAD-binding enzyme [Rhodospirillum rubrum]|uniref:TIGR03862 family flavoprotein n=1 Tax=Rhodospirillum rubrum TaxID=1085 RepID=UPI001908DBB7|nr:TIGR03862 family flavoprotein [Rhodospirillum rubrum]MBK1665190.1 aminoacetone oxidase family FAD-binding enzyme [Rhodospirillum rubrum]MBK1677066.1 aminoacetone oxidase family FAD-binding enzyme [Rhodospirillum rubrum]
MAQRETADGRVAVIGGGPAGLMAAERIAEAGFGVDVFDAMPSLGRKLLMAGRGGLNITHSEPLERFLERYGAGRTRLEPMIRAFSPEALRGWLADLGQPTVVGSSGRVFPQAFKASPLLRAWLRRLDGAGVAFHPRHRWLGWDEDGTLAFTGPTGRRRIQASATVLALGGASWPRLGSDGAWVGVLEAKGIAVSALRPANCGFDVGWSAVLADRFAGAPLKPVVATFAGEHRRGECVLTRTGVEGGLIYAFSAALREAIAGGGGATLILDLMPDHPAAALEAALARPRGGRSLATHLKRCGVGAVQAALLREGAGPADLADPAVIARRLKALPLRLVAPRPLAEAISTAGGVAFAELSPSLMLRALPGVFCCGEMLDWEAPTGGYLLTACLATGRAAGQGVARYLAADPSAAA